MKLKPPFLQPPSSRRYFSTPTRVVSILQAIILPSVLLQAIILLVPCHAQTSFDWTGFPTAAWSCLDYHTVQLTTCDPSLGAYLWNYCLYTNTENWIANVAACLGQKDPDDVSVVWATMAQTCSSTSTPITFTLDDFKRAAGQDSSAGDGDGGGEPTTTTTTDTPGGGDGSAKTTVTTAPGTGTGDSTNGGDGRGGGGGLSTSDKIAIGIGVPVGVFSIVGGIATWWMCCRRR